MKINKNGFELIKEFEGLRLSSYLCSAGVPTIGYGHTKDVEMGMEISEAEAEEYFRQDLAEFEETVNSEIVKVPLNEDQFSALVSFAFNAGKYAFEDSTLLKLLNNEDYQGAADQLLLWVAGEDEGLLGRVRRRKAERALFLGMDWKVYL